MYEAVRNARLAVSVVFGRWRGQAPEIDGVVRLLPPEKISKTFKVGDFTKARIVGTQGHDLVAMPI